MVNIQVKRSVRLRVKKTLLSQAAVQTLEFAQVPSSSDISIVIADDLLLKQLNHKYRDVDATTDVLSFLSSEPDPVTKAIYLGDVVISLPRAEEQSAAGGHSLADELQLLVVHGTLHLLGYDHLEDADKSRMQAAQDKILNQLGVKLKITL